MPEKKDIKKVELKNSESHLIEAQLKILANIQAEIAQKQYTAEAVEQRVSAEIKRIALANGLKGEHFVYANGSIEVEEQSSQEPVSADKTQAETEEESENESK